MSYVTVLCADYKELVDARLQQILGVDEFVPGMPGAFGQRNKAAREVLDRMNDRERKEVFDKVERYKLEGYDPKTQQR